MPHAATMMKPICLGTRSALTTFEIGSLRSVNPSRRRSVNRISPPKKAMPIRCKRQDQRDKRGRIAQGRGPIRELEPLRESEHGCHYSGPFTNPMKMPPPMTPAHSASETHAASLPDPADAPGRTALPWIV